VIMSKSVTTMADTKTVGVQLKEEAQKFQADIAKMADPAAIANAAAGKVMSQVQGSVPNPTAALGNVMGSQGGVPNPTATMGNVMGSLGSVPNPLAAQGGGAPRKTNHLRSIKKYKREYKQSLREIRKTRKNILRCIKNMI